MKLFSSVQKIILKQSSILKAQQFSEAVFQTTDYRDTNQLNPEKIKQDHFVSKIGEEAVAQVFREIADVTGPDYNIYERKQKSWQADLFINKMPLAVKTQTKSSALRYGLSWTFQNGVKRKDAILQQPDAWVCFVEYDDSSFPFAACYVLPPFQIRELFWGEPKLPHVRAHKKVVYASTLPKMPVVNWHTKEMIRQ